MSSKVLESIVVEPTREADACVIWLHGLGADGYDFVDIIPSLKLPVDMAIRFVFPHAPQRPVTLNQGMVMRAWFDIFALERNAKMDEVGIAAADRAIRQLIEAQISAGMASNRIFLVGFSQGGALALYTALHFEKALAGVIGLSTYLPMQAVPVQKQPSALPIFLAHGLLDPIVPYWMGHQSIACLEERGYHPVWHSYPIHHTVCLPECEDIGRWLVKHLL